jgi:hypothetical protein
LRNAEPSDRKIFRQCSRGDARRGLLPNLGKIAPFQLAVSGRFVYQ